MTPLALPSWQDFDAAWYRATYALSPEEDAQADYFLVAARSPNRFFDEAFYRARYPEVEASIAAGHFRSGFDHYRQVGLHLCAPHWLFDVEFYAAGSPDITPEALAAGGFENAYDHYLRVGCTEGRLAHPLFDPARFGAPFPAYLAALDERQPERPTSLYFDLAWYRDTYPQALAAVASKSFRGLLHHYLCNASPEFDPLCDFSETFYRARYPDVAQAVEAGFFVNGYLHFLKQGVFERRSPTAYIDLDHYWRHEAVRRDIQSGQVRDAFAHLLTIGIPEGLSLAPFAAPPDIAEEKTRALFAAQAQSLLPIFARSKLDFTVAGKPVCSVVIALSNGFPLAMLTLASLRQNLSAPIELILVDNGSADGVRQIERYVAGAILLRFDTNIGFPRACNAGLQVATADAVLFLNSDVRLEYGALDAALARLHSDPAIGAVGGKIVRTNETLQEAGCIVWRDGWTTGYLRGASPLAAEACFTRDVDFCSAVFLLARTPLMHQLGGFDDAFSPAYFEDADLGLRIWQSGYRVIYDPAIVLHHYEHGSSRDPRAALALMRASHGRFVEKHALTLQSRPDASPVAELFARDRASRHRMLFIEDTIPLRTLGSGYVRANDIIAAAAAQGCHVTVFPIHPADADPAAIHAEFSDDVEIIHDRGVDDLEEFLAQRPGFFETIWISRTHNLDRIRPILDAAFPADRSRPRPHIVLDTEAIAATRTRLRATVLDHTPAEDLRAALLDEFRNAGFADIVLAVNAEERGLLLGIGLQNVTMLGTCRAVSTTPLPFAQRDGMLFMGSLHAAGTPNHDSLEWFVAEVLPLVEAELGYETRLTIAGYVAPGLDLENFENHGRITLQGPVVNLEPLYNRHRIAIAPTRFAAGTPYKVYEAAALGLPVVTTTLLANQLGWTDGNELLAAPGEDPHSFARQVVRLYRSETLWNDIRAAATARIGRDHDSAAFALTVADILGSKVGLCPNPPGEALLDPHS